MHQEVQKIYLSIFLSLYLKILAIASGALNAPPTILSSNYFELNYEDGAHYI
jgi:hypothetical protein